MISVIRKRQYGRVIAGGSRSSKRAPEVSISFSFLS